MQDKITEGKTVAQADPEERCERACAWAFSQCGTGCVTVVIS